MATLRTMNRRRFRKANPVSWPTPTIAINAAGETRFFNEALRGGYWVRYSPRKPLNDGE